MRMQKTLIGAGGLAFSLLATGVMAQSLTQAEIDSLGTTLTPIGAQKEGNAAGTIPEWTGGLPTDAGQSLPNNFLESPFKDDQPEFVITAQNYQQYKDNLTPGQIALFERYPETFKMPVYKTERSVGFPQSVYDQVKATAGQGKLVNGGDGISGFAHGSFAFPIPKSGAEVVWNHNTRYRLNIHRWYMQAMPQTNGSFTLIKMEEEVGYPEQMSDVDASTMPNTLLFFKQRVNAPARLAGNVLLVHDSLDQLKEPRMAWVYNAGQRRVRRAPQVAYDGPGTASDGMRTSDNFSMYNGAPDRYDWTLVGKKEIYIPYNSGKLTEPGVQYDDVLQAGHINPDFTRFELHRVWEVQGNVKDGQRHIYAQRNFFVDEDSWMISLADHYDGRGTLWRVGEGHIGFNYQQKIPGYSIETLYDLLAGRYIALGMYTEENSAPQYDFDPSYNQFTPAALRASGVR
ncbi:MAG: outer membrane lipoprotein-sorting protein [Pseudomonadales bacterium]|nr:outer membrane lipoprotein-sorting protein [Pseudomonadales bacterium]